MIFLTVINGLTIRQKAIHERIGLNMSYGVKGLAGGAVDIPNETNSVFGLLCLVGWLFSWQAYGITQKGKIMPKTALK